MSRQVPAKYRGLGGSSLGTTVRIPKSVIAAALARNENAWMFRTVIARCGLSAVLATVADVRTTLADDMTDRLVKGLDPDTPIEIVEG